MSTAESPEHTIARLQAELAAAVDRANTAETQLLEVHQAVRAFREKRELVAQTRLIDGPGPVVEQPKATHSAPIPETAPSEINSSMSKAAWDEPDPSLDERLTEYLDKDFEPDRSRKWMLE